MMPWSEADDNRVRAELSGIKTWDCFVGIRRI